eukprot:8359932-Ditylum_brightwellii.AAC.1
MTFSNKSWERLSTIQYSDHLHNSLVKRAYKNDLEASSYLCPYEPGGQLKMWFYNAPRIGGHQKLLGK